MTWYVLQHKPLQGERALQNLERQGITCFYPKVRVEKIRKGKRSLVLEPLFPGYIFVEIDENSPQWSKLPFTRGVIRVVSFGQKPAPIAHTVVEQLKCNIELVTEQGGLRPGQEVELQEGPFEGLKAIFQTFDGEERAIVMISFMQKYQEIAVRVIVKSGV